MSLPLTGTILSVAAATGAILALLLRSDETDDLVTAAGLFFDLLSLAIDNAAPRDGLLG